MFVAVVGCGHGEIDKIYEVVAGIETQRSIKVSLVVCSGDFQSVRNMTDLRCMACPVKYQQMHDFHRYYSGEKKAPIPTIFVGGNHEASNFLQELPYGGWVAPNIFFLGSNVIRFGSLRIAGISGIFKGHDYLKGKFECPPYDHSSMRSVYHYRNIDTFRLKQVKSKIDIVLSHDWPQNIHLHGDTLALLQRKPYFREEIERGNFGSRPLGDLLHHLQPSYWFSAHLHVKFGAVVRHEVKVSEKAKNYDQVEGQRSSDDAQEVKVTKFLALDKILPRRQFLQVVEIPCGNDNVEEKFFYDAEWLAILKSTNHLLSIKETSSYMPGPNSHGERFDFGPTDDEMTEVHDIAQGNFEIPANFVQTAPAYEVGESPGLAYPLENPQTTDFCAKWEVSDPIRFLPSYTNGLGGGGGIDGSGNLDVAEEPEGQEVNFSFRKSADAISFTQTPFNPDEISVEDDDSEIQECGQGQSESQPFCSKLSLPPPRNEGRQRGEGKSEKEEEDALKFLTSDFSLDEEGQGSLVPLFVLDRLGEPEKKRSRRNAPVEENNVKNVTER